MGGWVGRARRRFVRCPEAAWPGWRWSATHWSPTKRFSWTYGRSSSIRVLVRRSERQRDFGPDWSSFDFRHRPTRNPRRCPDLEGDSHKFQAPDHRDPSLPAGRFDGSHVRAGPYVCSPAVNVINPAPVSECHRRGHIPRSTGRVSAGDAAVGRPLAIARASVADPDPLCWQTATLFSARTSPKTDSRRAGWREGSPHPGPVGNGLAPACGGGRSGGCEGWSLRADDHPQSR